MTQHGTAPQPQFTDFNGMRASILPHYSVRLLRTLVRNGVIPSIKLPGGRKRTFHMPSVITALRRHQTGGH